MPGKNHSLTSLLEEMAAITGQAYVVLQCENNGGSHRLEQAFPALGVDDLDTLSDGPLIIAYGDDAQARDGCNAIMKQALQGYETTCSIVTSTVTFIGRANEGECSRTSALKLVAEVASDDGDRLFWFTVTGHLVAPRSRLQPAL